METKFKVISERGEFTGSNLYKLLQDSKIEFSKSYMIFKNDNNEWVLFDKVTRELDNKGQIKR